MINDINSTNCKLAPITTASFFVIAIVEWFYRLLHFVRNDKKDIVESGIKLLKKRDIGCPTSLVILKFRNIVSEKSVVKVHNISVFVNFLASFFECVSKCYKIQNSTACGNYFSSSVICTCIKQCAVLNFFCSCSLVASFVILRITSRTNHQTNCFLIFEFQFQFFSLKTILDNIYQIVLQKR